MSDSQERTLVVVTLVLAIIVVFIYMINAFKSTEQQPQDRYDGTDNNQKA